MRKKIKYAECQSNSGGYLKVCSALYFADNFYLVPRVTDIKYIDTIIDIAIKENIDLIVQL